MLGNTNRDEIGEQFVRRYLAAYSVETSSGGRTWKTDVRVEQLDLASEVNTASMGANRTFRLNHIRPDRRYDYLPCVGICPDRAVSRMWGKGEVAEERAGRLVRRAEGQSVSYKITKKPSDLHPIEGMPERIRTVLASQGGQHHGRAA